MRRERDNRRFWMNVLTSAVVAVVVFLVMSWISPNIGLAPKSASIDAQPLPPPDPSGVINAHSCNADGICETKELLVGADHVFYQEEVLGEGENVNLRVGGKVYNVAISFISNDSVKLIVNGALTPSLREGQTYGLADGSRIGVEDIMVQDFAGGLSMVNFFIVAGFEYQGNYISGNEVRFARLAESMEYSLGGSNLCIDEYGRVYKTGYSC